jgi:ketosteroid isomerase-like protein
MLTLLAVALAAACYPSETVVDMEVEIASLTEVAQAYHDGAAVMDIEAVYALHSPEAVVYAPDTPTIDTPDGIREFMAGFESAPGISVDLDLADVVVSAGGAMGYTLGVGTITMDGPDGEPVVEQVRDFHVWVKDADGVWKLVVDIWNSPVPVMEGEH